MGKWNSAPYLRDTRVVAKDLIGKYLVRVLDAQLLVGRISETEAYIADGDKACHAYQNRRTPRTEILFAAGGVAYIYLVYGMHSCLNLVTEPAEKAGAVLIRGLQPRNGLDTMAQNRFGHIYADLTAYQKKNFLNGPGKVCQGLALTVKDNGLSLLGEELYVCDSLRDLGLPPDPDGEKPLDIKIGKRIGIDYAEECADYLWRFYL